MPNKPPRRQFLRAAGLATLGFLAGCAGQPTNSNTSAQTEPNTTSRRTTTTATTKSTPTETSTASPETATAEPNQSVQHNHQSTEQPEFSDQILSKAQNLGKKVQKSVVKLTDGGRGGTGWIIEDGYIMTNSHVVFDSKTMDVETFGGKTGTATRIGYHQDMIPDIALMKTEIDTPDPLPVKTNASISKGDPVLMVGHPGSVGDWVISLGRYDSYQPGINWVLSDIPTKQGNSGSPLLTLDGDVIACVSGETTMNNKSSGANRPEKVYTEFPEPETKTTGTPSKSIMKWVGEWK